MSRENVEMLRQRYDAMNRALAAGEDLTPMMDLLDPDIVVEMGVLEGTFRGPAGFKQFIEGQVALLDGLRCEPKEFIDAGDRVVVPMRLSGRARSNGLPFEYDAIHVWTLRRGKATHLRLYESYRRARLGGPSDCSGECGAAVWTVRDVRS